MMAVRIAALAIVCALLPPLSADGDEKLTLRVTPAVSQAPALVLVRAFVAVDADNRALQIAAESEDFYTSSQVPLRGDRAPRINEVRFAGLPPGSYEISATLLGSQGRRAAVSRSIIVAGGF